MEKVSLITDKLLKEVVAGVIPDDSKLIIKVKNFAGSLVTMLGGEKAIKLSNMIYGIVRLVSRMDTREQIEDFEDELEGLILKYNEKLYQD